jgi:hypothetical protein
MNFKIDNEPIYIYIDNNEINAMLLNGIIYYNTFEFDSITEFIVYYFKLNRTIAIGSHFWNKINFKYRSKIYKLTELQFDDIYEISKLIFIENHIRESYLCSNINSKKNISLYNYLKKFLS